MSQDEIMNILLKHSEGLILPTIKEIMNVKWIESRQIKALEDKKMIMKIPVISEGRNTWLLIPIADPEKKMVL